MISPIFTLTDSALNSYMKNMAAYFQTPLHMLKGQPMNQPTIAERFSLQGLSPFVYSQAQAAAANIMLRNGTVEDLQLWAQTNSTDEWCAPGRLREMWDGVVKARPLASTTASMLLGQARDIQEARAKEYDKPEGERSMDATTLAFNAITGRDISESEGWLFMAILKMVRDRSTKAGHRDSCEDLVAYSSLYGEARLAELAEHMLQEKFVVAIKGMITPDDKFAEAAKAIVEGTKVTVTREEVTQRMRLVAEQRGVGTTRFLIETFGKGQKMADLSDDSLQALDDALDRLYGSDFIDF